MLTKNYQCSHCGSEDLVKNGKNACGNQRVKCKTCGLTRVLTPLRKTDKIDKAAVYRTFEERNSYRSTARIFNISHGTVFNWIKKKQKV